MLTIIFLISCITLFLINEKDYQQTAWFVLVSSVLIWTFISYWIGLQESQLQGRINLRIINYIKIYILLIGFVIAFYSFSPFSAEAKNIVAAIVLGFPILGIPINFIVVSKIDQMRRNDGKAKYTLVAGVGNLAGNVEKHLLAHNGTGVKLKGFINCNKEECVVSQEKVVGDLDHINDYLKDNPVDEIVIAIPVKVSKKIKRIIAAADYHGVRVKYIPDYQGLFGENYKLARYGQLDAINVRQLPLDETSAFYIKNTFDKVFSALALLAMLPLFLVLAVLIKLDSPGPVFYCPVRVGKGGRPFKVFKFRSMYENDSAAGGTLSTQKDDPRVTRIGRILRKYSLDELPQFLNVLLGDMSVVGPRPHRSFLNQKLQESVDKYMIRHYFKPGITGWAQVNGWRGPTETDEQKRQRTLHDLWYMEKWSLWLDIKIIFRTIFSIKTHKSAY